MRIPRLHAYFACALSLTGCTGSNGTQEPSEPDVRFPFGADGYMCSRRESTPEGGAVAANASPDYRGSYLSLALSWETRARTPDDPLPEIKLFTFRGPKATGPPGWLSATQYVQFLPPLHTKIRLQLSSGELIERDFVEPESWPAWRRSDVTGYTGSVFTGSLEFIEAFSRAAWADVDVIDPTGVLHAHERVDLSALPATLAVMRRLGAEVEANAADYEHRCHPVYIEETN
jgi:hypothetical protein